MERYTSDPVYKLFTLGDKEFDRERAVAFAMRRKDSASKTKIIDNLRQHVDARQASHIVAVGVLDINKSIN